MSREDLRHDYKAAARRATNRVIRREIEDRLADGPKEWIDLPTLKRLVEGHLGRAKDRTELTPEQRRLAAESEGLAIRFATVRWRKAKRAWITFDEVVAAAKMGLEDAIARFDPAKGKLGGFAWGYMMRRVVELHESHSPGGDGRPRPVRDPRDVGRANRWDLDAFEWPEYPDVARELRRMATTPDAPFTAQDLDILEMRAGRGKSIREVAVALGCSVDTVRRRERAAAGRVRPFAESLRETSTDRYLLSVLSPDEIVRVYGKDAPTPELRAMAEEAERRRGARGRYLGVQADRYGYGRNAVTDGTDEVPIG